MYKVDKYYCSRKICVITNISCNLNCIYCYQGKGTGTFNVENTKEKLIALLNTKTEKGTVIKLLGGEPFLIFPKIKDLCESIWDSSPKENFIFLTTTNGTLVHGEIQEWLLKNKDRFQVKLSLDGNKEAQNINRPGSFDKIDLDFFSNTWPDIGVKTTISPLSLPLLAESIIFLHKKFRTIRPNFAELIDWGRDDILVEYKKQLQLLSDFYLANPGIKPCKLYNIPFRRTLNKSTRFCQCTLGSREVIDYNTGKNYPCHFFMPSVCGKEKSEELSCIDMSQPDLLVSHNCKICPFLNICVTCYAANYIQRGDPSMRDPMFCKMQRLQFVMVAKYMIAKYIQNGYEISDEPAKVEIYQDIKAIQYLLPFMQRIENELE